MEMYFQKATGLGALQVVFMPLCPLKIVRWAGHNGRHATNDVVKLRIMVIINKV
jgi:hypothetical protein